MEYFYMLNHGSCRQMSRFTGHLELMVWLLMARPPKPKSAPLHVSSVLYRRNHSSPNFAPYAFAQSLRALIATDAFLCNTKPNFNLILSPDSFYFI